MKIAIRLDNDRNIIGTVTTNELGAELQVKLFSDKGWVLIESNSAFSNDEAFKWTIRESDGKLVHKSTGMTPDEEKTQADALLGKNVGTALAAAQGADKKADNAVAGLAQFGKLVAPLLATAQPSSNTDDGGTK